MSTCIATTTKTIYFFTYKQKAEQLFRQNGIPIQINSNFDCLSNYYPCIFTYLDVEWPSSEHAYQASKFIGTHDEFAKTIRTEAKTAHAAKELGGLRSGLYTSAAVKALIKKAKEEQKVSMLKDWDDVKQSIMHDIVLAKFSQIPRCKEILLQTKQDILKEASPYDDYWGIGRQALGKNYLGKILMEVRTKLHNNNNQNKVSPDIGY